ncbi:MAG: hypothetical protein HOD60_06495 [Candidatus Nitrosopelagicus sp.]|nr:hypothetical protein [Candidatus Nitrosopelagicus sp.]
MRTTERVAKMTTTSKFHCDKCKQAFENTIWTYMKYQSITLGIDNPKEIAMNTMDRVIEAITTFSPEIEGNTEYE